MLSECSMFSLQRSQPEVEREVVSDWSVGEAGDTDEGVLAVEGSEVGRGERQGSGRGAVSLFGC